MYCYESNGNLVLCIKVYPLDFCSISRINHYLHHEENISMQYCSSYLHHDPWIFMIESTSWFLYQCSRMVWLSSLETCGWWDKVRVSHLDDLGTWFRERVRTFNMDKWTSNRYLLSDMIILGLFGAMSWPNIVGGDKITIQLIIEECRGKLKFIMVRKVNFLRWSTANEDDSI